MFFDKFNLKNLCIILVLVSIISVLPINTSTAKAKSIETALSVADYKLFPMLYPLDASAKTLNALEQHYNETKEAAEKMDDEAYNSFYVTAYSESLKKALNFGLENAKTYTGDDTYLDDIVSVINDYIALLDIVTAKASGVEVGKEVTPGFQNFDFTKPGINFSDVPKGRWYSADVAKVSASGIMQGTGNNMYTPDKILTKAEAMILFGKLNAIYYGREEELNRFLAAPQGHWASGIIRYCSKYELPFLRIQEFDESCTRMEMAMLIMNAFPKDSYKTTESAYTKVNSLFELNENPEKNCGELFMAGIFMGSDKGLEPKGYLTRSQAASLVYRAAYPPARIKLRDYLYIPEELKSSYPSNHCTIGANGPGAPSKPVFSIKGTVWNPGAIDFTGNLNTVGNNAYMPYLRYGNHKYFAYNEEQYNYVANTALEALEIANNTQAITDKEYHAYCQTYINPDKKQDFVINGYLNGEFTYEEMIDKYFHVNDTSSRASSYIKRLDEYKTTYNLTSKTDIVNLIRIFETVAIMRTHLSKIASENWVPDARKYTATVTKDGVTYYQDNEVYYFLTKGLKMDCDGYASISMLIWDTLGFSTRMVDSEYANHGCAEVYLGGKWMALNRDCLPVCTHEEMLEDIAIFQSVKSDDLAGVFADLCGIDLSVSIPPTHNSTDFRFNTPIPLNN